LELRLREIKKYLEENEREKILKKVNIKGEFLKTNVFKNNTLKVKRKKEMINKEG